MQFQHQIIFLLIAIIIQLVFNAHAKSVTIGNKRISELLSSLNIVDFVDNGWVELNPSYTDECNKYMVKCDSSFAVNSNTSFVRKQQKEKSSKKSGSEKSTQWTPVNDYQIKNVPLCAKRCKYQSYLPNGLIQIDSLHKLDEDSELNQQHPFTPIRNSAMFVNLIENSRIKYECVNGFQLQRVQLDQSSNPEPFLLNKAIHVEQCLLSESEQQQRKEFTTQKNEKEKPKEKKKKKEEYDEDSDFKYYKRDTLPIVVSSMRTAKQPVMPSYFYECVKFCQPFKTQQIKSNGFIVPLRDLFAPGEHLTYMCHEGYAAEMPVLEIVSNNSSYNETQAVRSKISNVNTFVCSSNGTWHLLLSQGSSNNRQSMLISPNDIKSLPHCASLRELLRTKEGSAQDSENDPEAQAETESSTTNDQIIYTELNIRSLCLMLTVGGILVVLLVLSVLALKFYKTRRDTILYQSYLPQLENHQIFEPPPPPSSIHGLISTPPGGSSFGRSMLSSTPNSSLTLTTSGTSDRTRLIGHTIGHQFQSCLVPPVIPRSMPLLDNGSVSRSDGAYNTQLTVGLSLPSYEEAVLQQQQQHLNLNETDPPSEYTRATTTSLGNIFHVNQILRSNPLTSNSASLAASRIANQFALGSHLFVTANTSVCEGEKTAAAGVSSLAADCASQSQPPPPPYISDSGAVMITTNELSLPSTTTANVGHHQHQEAIPSSRSGSIRSNMTVRSANPSIRTTNSIGTSSSIGNTSFNITARASCSGAHKKSVSKSSRKSNHSRHQHHGHHRAGNSTLVEDKSLRSTATVTTNATQETLSTCFDPDSSTTRTVNSFQSNRSDASKVAFKGSAGSVCNEAGEVSTIVQHESKPVDAVNDQNVFANDENERLLANYNESSSSPSGSSVDLSMAGACMDNQITSKRVLINETAH